MNDFDSVLELRLRHLLDPVVASQPPPRGSRRQRKPILTIETARFELAAEPVSVIEPVVTAVAQ